MNTRSSRQTDKSFGAGSQPLAMASSLAAFSPTSFRERGKIDFFRGLAGFFQTPQIHFRKGPPPAAAAAGMPLIAQALRMMSPR